MGKVLLAFGHQHLGLTQAAVTAEWVGQLIEGLRIPEAYRLIGFTGGRSIRGKPAPTEVR
jgi:D-amino-acid dehydrogenase